MYALPGVRFLLIMALCAMVSAPVSANQGAQAPANPAPGRTNALIPRRGYALSPTGGLLAWVETRPDGDAVLVARRTDPTSPIFDVRAPAGVESLRFAASETRLLLQLSDRGGVLSAQIDPEQEITAPAFIDLTRIGEPGEVIAHISPLRTRRVLLERHSLNGDFESAWRVDVETGEREEASELDARVDALYAPFRAIADASLSVRVVMERGPGGAIRARRVGPEGGAIVEASAGRRFDPIGMSADGSLLYALDDRGLSRTALTATDVATGESTVLADDPTADVDEALLHPLEGFAQAARFASSPAQWFALQRSLAPDLRNLLNIPDGAGSVIDRSVDDSIWLVEFERASGNIGWSVIDRNADTATVLPVSSRARELNPSS